jgi:hypothetical protein
MSMLFFLQSLFYATAVTIVLSVVSRSSCFPSNMPLTIWLRHSDKGTCDGKGLLLKHRESTSSIYPTQLARTPPTFMMDGSLLSRISAFAGISSIEPSCRRDREVVDYRNSQATFGLA